MRSEQEGDIRKPQTKDKRQRQFEFAYIEKVLRSVPDQISTAMLIQYSLGGNIHAESFSFVPEVFFVKDCIEQNTCFVAVVNFPWEINSSNM